MNWHVLPDIAAVGLLVCAFASVSRHSPTPAARVWLTGWLMIMLHFFFSLFQPANETLQLLVQTVVLSSLLWAGILFMAATLPNRQQRSSQWMLWTLLTVNTLTMFLQSSGIASLWMLYACAALLGLGPLSILLLAGRGANRWLRYITVVLYVALSLFLLLTMHRPNSAELAVNGLLATVYLGCCCHFLVAYRRATAGAFVTIAGFLAWASVFIVGPLMINLLPQYPVESEVWNLPKYVVAVGMILLLLEEQIEHNKFLALHDELTGLANRRLFQDRLNNALERSRRSGSQVALLLVDLDRFKQVNDTLGHHIGDLLLQHVGQVFSARVRKSDTVARTGGDEFAIILEAPTTRSNAEQVGGALLKLLEDPIELGDKLLQCGASLGVAVFPDDAEDEETLRIVADTRMYEHKNARRDSEALAYSQRDATFASTHDDMADDMNLV